MRIALGILMAIHGLIHLIGFLKAFGLSEFNAIHQPISKTFGIVWLVASVIIFITLLLFLFDHNYWWLSALLGILTSQILIFTYWSDTKFGTVVNIIMLGVVLLAYAKISFHDKIALERKKLFEISKSMNNPVITTESISDLPEIVQKWLTTSGAVGMKPISNVYLVQDLQLKLKTEQENWYHGTAEQYFSVNPPAFNWNINTTMNSFLGVVGRDKLENGNGQMTIKLLSLITVANAKDSDKIDQATLQRYLAEIVWFPTASLSEYVTWEGIDENSAKATLTINNQKGSGIFHFDDTGNFQKFTALRFKDIKDKEPSLWTVTALQTSIRNAVNIPTEVKVEWELETGNWTWLKLKIKEIAYNVEQMPVRKT